MNSILQEDLQDIVNSSIIDWEKLRNRTIFITGATGLIGSILVKALIIKNKTCNLNLSMILLVRNKEEAEKIFEKNKYMNNVYPGDARYILEPFKVECGEMEFFDLTQKPIYRKTFKINTEESTYFNKKYVITDNCIECDVCKATCPQNAIEEGSPYHIMPNHCLDCGTCYENCPVNAIEDPY